jgi:succinate dehydrogenase / fumarate reductase cytochrome b subunit
MNETIENSSYSLVSKKIFLGFSGLILLSFIVGHLLGNMSMFVGQEAINAYAYFLHKNKGPVNMARIFLLINLVTHIYFSINLTLINNAASKTAYAVQKNIQTSLASKTMIYSGLIIFAFLIYHLLHFTFGFINPDSYGLIDNKNRTDVYTMVVHGFSNGYISIIYITSLSFLGLHLSHAFFSVCQTFSITSTKNSIHKSKQISKIIACVIFLGYVMIPISVFFKII